MSALSSNTVRPSGIPGKKHFHKKLKVFNGQQHVMYATTTTIQAVWPHTSMLKALNWHTLEYRRNHSSLMYFYKIRNVLVHVDHHHLIPTRNLNYLIPHSNTQYHSNSYFPRTIRLWNSLPGTVQASPSLAIFATRLAAVPLKYRYSH